MMAEICKFRHNVMGVSTISTFEKIRGGINNNCKDVYFVRAIGVNAAYIDDINDMDHILTSRMNEGRGYYFRINSLPDMKSISDANFYSDCYTKWVESGRREVEIHTTCKNKARAIMLGNACRMIEEIYSRVNRQTTNSICRNLMVKMLFWYDSVFADEKIVWNEKCSYKIAASNIVKKQEYLFFYLVTLMGCDVLLLQSRKDIEMEEEKLGFSTKFVLGDFSEVEIPLYKGSDSGIQKEHVTPLSYTESSSKRNEDSEKSFEELAQLASSVVLIEIHNDRGETIGSGSGIMIGKDGYILTNNHVVSGGRFYSVRIEDDENVYTTDEIIKYNYVLDLAIIRIDRELSPIPVYRGNKKLVRGQKVVAIGSPLGLFNSVSDGIISGFRKIDQVDMIQFTAPISHGSSGGAVLNMQGEVIGISTAGIDTGQNINLAMGYECIHTFIHGFDRKQ